MSASAFASLEAAILDPLFPEVDLALRRGRHLGRDDGPLYDFLLDGQAHLEAFYQRFGCELVHRTDGYFFLLPTNDRLGRRQLSVGEMLVGQTLALLYLDPATLQRAGVVPRELVLERLAGLLGAEALVRAFHPRRRRLDERVAAESVRAQVGEALRRLAELGFLDLLDGTDLRLRPALMRFADPVRGLEEPQAVLAAMITRGEAALADAPTAEATDEEGVTEEEAPS